MKFTGVLVDMQPSYLKDHDQKQVEKIVSNQISVLKYCAQNDYPLAILECGSNGKTIRN